MKNTTAIILAGLMTVLLTGCTRPANENTPPAKNAASSAGNVIADARNNNAPAGAATPGNANSNAGASGSDAASSTPDPTKLLGVFELNQVEKEGIVTMMTQATTQIIFTADGHYTRSSSVKSQQIHTESGEFHLEGDTLVFSTEISDNQIKKPAVDHRYKITLSADGREIKMISKKGDTGIFRRVS